MELPANPRSRPLGLQCPKTPWPESLSNRCCIDRTRSKIDWVSVVNSYIGTVLSVGPGTRTYEIVKDVRIWEPEVQPKPPPRRRILPDRNAVAGAPSRDLRAKRESNCFRRCRARTLAKFVGRRSGAAVLCRDTRSNRRSQWCGCRVRTSTGLLLWKREQATDAVGLARS